MGWESILTWMKHFTCFRSRRSKSCEGGMTRNEVAMILTLSCGFRKKTQQVRLSLPGFFWSTWVKGVYINMVRKGSICTVADVCKNDCNFYKSFWFFQWKLRKLCNGDSSRHSGMLFNLVYNKDWGIHETHPSRIRGGKVAPSSCELEVLKVTHTVPLAQVQHLCVEVA